jgi:hypothetical protein
MLNENISLGNNEIKVGYPIEIPALYTTEIDKVDLFYQLIPPVPNKGFSTVEIKIICRVINSDKTIIFSAQSTQLFEFQNLIENEKGYKVIIEALKKSCINLYNRIHEKNIKSPLMNQISSHFTLASHNLSNASADIGYVFSSLDLGS